jgi:hypothetical protein
MGILTVANINNRTSKLQASIDRVTGAANRYHVAAGSRPTHLLIKHPKNSCPEAQDFIALYFFNERSAHEAFDAAEKTGTYDRLEMYELGVRRALS